MKVLIDACVLYPTVLREIVIGCAEAGLFTPFWSARILEEWARAAARHGAEIEAVARAEIAVLRDRHPSALVPAEAQDGLILPDPDDVHVLAAAIRVDADLLLTQNLRDFPARALAPHGLVARDPDRFLRACHDQAPEAVRAVVARVHRTACDLSGEDLPLRPLLKRARLPRLAKALAT